MLSAVCCVFYILLPFPFPHDPSSIKAVGFCSIFKFFGTGWRGWFPIGSFLRLAPGQLEVLLVFFLFLLYHLKLPSHSCKSPWLFSVSNDLRSQRQLPVLQTHPLLCLSPVMAFIRAYLISLTLLCEPFTLLF